MGEKLRTFMAIDIPAEPLRDVLEELGGLGRPLRVVTEPLHLTLKFLGETRQSAVPSVAAAITDVCSRHAPLDVEIRGISAFPRPERPSVIWAGVYPAEPLAAVAIELEEHLKPLGFPAEERAFHPHVTLARLKGRPPQALSEIMELYAEESFGVTPVRHIVLYESVLSADGPQYTMLHRAVLGAPATTE